ncbi:MAG: glycosyltransferase family 4 protein [Gaiellaceae bacterium]
MTGRPRDVFHFTDSNSFGGAEKALLSLAAGLDAQRWTSTLVYHPSPGITPLVERAGEAGLRLLPVRPMPEGLQGARRAVSFAWVLRRPRPDVFHAHLTWPLACKFGLAAAVAARVPVVVATHHLVPPFTLGRQALLQQRLLDFGVASRLAVSEDTARRLQALFGWPREKISVVHNGIPEALDAPQPDPYLRARLLRGRRALLVVPARLDPLKGHEFLFKAALSLEGVQVVVAGDGPERARLELQAKELGLAARVTFLGFRDDMRRLLACADVVVLPSVAEGLPLAVLEAMAAGVPLVATRVGGTSEAVIDEVTGLLVPPQDPPALAAAIQRVLADPQAARRRAEAGAARVKAYFTSERMIASVESVYDALLMGRGLRGHG